MNAAGYATPSVRRLKGLSACMDSRSFVQYSYHAFIIRLYQWPRRGAMFKFRIMLYGVAYIAKLALIIHSCSKTQPAAAFDPLKALSWC